MRAIEQHRSDLDELTRLAKRDLAVLWRHVTSNLIALELLNDVLPGLVALYGSAAATLAADWYDDLREEAEVSGRFAAVVAELPGATRTESLAGWVSGMFDEAGAAVSLTAAQGGLQRIVADADRQTITQSAVADPGAHGWQRSAAGGCGFCRMLESRGAVYSRATVDFGSHDHCRCLAVPAWGGQAVPVKPYVPSDRNVTPADRARVRKWMAQHGY